MKLFVLVFIIAFLASLTPQHAQAAFVVRLPVADTGVVAATSYIKTHIHKRDRGWGQRQQRDNLGLLACILAYAGLLGIGVLALAVWLGVFAGVALWVTSLLLGVLIAAYIAGFVLGWVALSKKPEDRRYAISAILIGSLLFSPIVTFVLTIILYRPRKYGR